MGAEPIKVFLAVGAIYVDDVAVVEATNHESDGEALDFRGPAAGLGVDAAVGYIPRHSVHHCKQRNATRSMTVSCSHLSQKFSPHLDNCGKLATPEGSGVPALMIHKNTNPPTLCLCGKRFENVNMRCVLGVGPDDVHQSGPNP